MRSLGGEEIFAVDKRVVRSIDGAARPAIVFVARASKRQVQNFIHDGGEVGINLVNGVGPEITSVIRMFSAVSFEKPNSGDSQGFRVQRASKEGQSTVTWWTVCYPAFLDVEFALGDALGDSDGDGMGVADIDSDGIRGGLIGVFEPNDLEARDRVEGESPRASGGEIV